MRATEFFNEEAFGTHMQRAARLGSRPSRQAVATPCYTEDEEYVAEEEQLDERGKASKALCLSSRPTSQLGASQASSCKAQGFRRREVKGPKKGPKKGPNKGSKKGSKKGKNEKNKGKSHLINGKRVYVAGKKIKGAAYGGPLPDWS